MSHLNLLPASKEPSPHPCPLPAVMVSLRTEAGAQKGGEPQIPQKGCSSPAPLCYTLESLLVTQPVAEGAERAVGGRTIQISPCRLMRQIKLCMFCHFFANGLQIWWVNRDDSPLPGEMSRVKLSTLVWYAGRLGGKSPTSTPSENLLGIFGLSTNSTHKTRPEKLLKEESCAWNPGDFTCRMSQGSPRIRDALLRPLSIWLRKMVLHHTGQQRGIPLAQAQHILARNKQGSSCTHTGTVTHTRAG